MSPLGVAPTIDNIVYTTIVLLLVTEEDEPLKVNAFNPDQYVNEKPIVSDFANLAKMNSQKGEARYG